MGCVERGGESRDTTLLWKEGSWLWECGFVTGGDCCREREPWFVDLEDSC